MAGIKQVMLRVPDDLADEVDARRVRLGLSRNEWIVRALRWAVGQPINETRKVERT